MKKPRELSSLEIKLNAWVTKYLTRIPFIQKMFFIDHLKTMIHAGLSITESLDTLSKEIENKKLKGIIAEIKIGIEKGNQLSEVLAKYPQAFPPIYVKMVESGEVSGKLEESLTQIVEQMQKTQELNSSIRGAMIYPAVILVAMGGIGIMMVTVVLPKLMTLFEEFDTESEKFEGINKEIAEVNITVCIDDQKKMDSNEGDKARADAWFKEIKKDAYIYEAIMVVNDTKTAKK